MIPPIRSMRMAKAFLVVFLATGQVPLAASAVNSQAAGRPPATTPLERVRAVVQPSIVYQETTWEATFYDKYNKMMVREEPFSVNFQCTGFLINPSGFILTAGHCVEYDESVRAALLDEAASWAVGGKYYKNENLSYKRIREFAEEDWKVRRKESTVIVGYGVRTSGLPTGKALPARVAALRGFEKGDVALLKIEGEDLHALQLAPEEEVQVGTEVVAVGYPASVDLVTDNTFTPSFKNGSVSNIRTVGGGLSKVYEISAAVSGGMSGGPTVNLSGEVIGINSFGIRGEEQPFNFISPASTGSEVLQDEGVQNEVGEVGAAYLAGLTAYFRGDRTTALKRFNQVLDLVPSHELALEFKQKTLRLPLPPPASGGFPIGLGVGIVAAALLAGGGLLFLRTRRKPPAAAKVSSSPGGTVATTPTVDERAEKRLVPAQRVPEGSTVRLSPATAGVEDGFQESQGASKRFCPDCGTPRRDGAQFCESCGHRFTS